MPGDMKIVSHSFIVYLGKKYPFQQVACIGGTFRSMKVSVEFYEGFVDPHEYLLISWYEYLLIWIQWKRLILRIISSEPMGQEFVICQFFFLFFTGKWDFCICWECDSLYSGMAKHLRPTQDFPGGGQTSKLSDVATAGILNYKPSFNITDEAALPTCPKSCLVIFSLNVPL